MSWFRAADGMVRKATFLGAYRKGRSEGMGHSAAIEYAKKVNDDVNFDYSVADSPSFMRRTGPIGTLAFQFKKYPVKMMELALPGLGKLNGVQSARFWAFQLAMSGLFGLPAFDLIKNLLKSLFGKDLELETKKVIGESSLPTPIKKTLLYGALSNAGIDIGRRVGMGDFIPSDYRDFTGPALSTIWNVVEAMPKIFTDANFMDTIEAISPGAANPIKEFLTGETRDKRRGRTRFKYETGVEKGARALGFRPTREAVEGDAVRLANYEQAEKSERETAAIDDFIRAYEKKGAPEYQRARKRLSELKITPRRVLEEIKKRKAGSEYERKMRESRTRSGAERRKILQGYGSMR
jgi:hypothetical protein